MEVGNRGLWKNMKNWKKKINQKETWNLELWTDIKWVRFGRTELSISGSDAEFWDLSFEKGPRLPGSHPDRKKEEKLFEKNKISSFWRFFVTKSVGLRLPELLIGASDAEFWDLSFAMGPGAWFLCKYMIFLKKCPDFGNFLGAKKWKKSEMMDEMGRDGFKFGIFDMGRCALISGPQKCWFWPIFPNFLGVKIDFSFFGLFRALRIPSVGPY